MLPRLSRGVYEHSDEWKGKTGKPILTFLAIDLITVARKLSMGVKYFWPTEKW